MMVWNIGISGLSYGDFLGVHVTFPECMWLCFFCLKMGFEYRKGVGLLMNRRMDRFLVGFFYVPKVNVFKQF